MKVIRSRLIIFVALLFVFMIPQPASAEVNSIPPDFSALESQEGKILYVSPTEEVLITHVNITPVATDQNGQARAWYYTQDIERRVAYMPDETIKDQIYQSIFLDMLDYDGNSYIASGYLDHISTVYDFPNKGWKTAIYEGTVGCYIY